MSEGGLYEGEKIANEYRIVFAGNPSVGKTSIIYQMIEKKFYEELPTSIPDTQTYKDEDE